MEPANQTESTQPTNLAPEATNLPPETTRPVVTLKRRKALPLFSRHPWLFAGAIAGINGDPAPGDVVEVRDDTGRFVGLGLFNPHSQIRVRMYAWDDGQSLDDDFWRQKIEQAIEARRRLGRPFDKESACRLIFSEADGLSGLTVDRFGDYLALQLTSLALAAREPLIVEILTDLLQPRGIVRRTEKGVLAAEGLETADGLIAGEEPPRPLFIEEHGLRYGVDLIQGQKTGLFLDQRDNRLVAAGYMPEGKLLDLFCYGAGFSLCALRHGRTTESLAVDISEAALTLAHGNAKLNGLAARMSFAKEDGFRMLETLQAEGRKFSAIVLDPPKLARHRHGLAGALKGYYSLNRMAVDLLEPGGILVTCSCSGLVDTGMFEETLAKVSLHAKRPFHILERRGAAPDHPVSPLCPQTAYLKCDIIRVM